MIATVDKIVSLGIYLVRDQSGRTYRAASVERYDIGAQITVLSGQIVGRAGAQPSAKTYEV